MPANPMSDLCGYPYAHRGLWDGTIPENSLAAFQRAADAGFGIELDVRLTRDGTLVVMHDASLKRMCGVAQTVEESTLAELRQLQLRGTAEHVPTLREALEVIDGRAPVIVEIKKCKHVERVCAAVSALLAEAHGVYAVESFHPLAVRWFRQHAPNIARGQLIFGGRGRHWRKIKLMASLPGCWLSRPDFIACEAGVLSSAELLRLRRCCRCLALWTIRSQREMDDSAALCDMQIFEGFVPKR